MKERFTYEPIIQEENQEQEYELQQVFDNAVEREYSDHPELNSRRKKLIFIQDTFGWEADMMQIAHLLGINEDQTRKFLSRRGMRDNEFEELQVRFDGAFAITSMIAANVEKILPRRDTIVKPNALLEDKGVKSMLQNGETYKAVWVAEKSLMQNRD